MVASDSLRCAAAFDFLFPSLPCSLPEPISHFSRVVLRTSALALGALFLSPLPRCPMCT